MKWNVYNIVEFLNIYQQYHVLWNIKDTDYCNTKLKNETFQRLYNELSERQLIGEMDVKQLKAKIKSIKDVYRQELHKIEKSKKSVAGTEKVYLPKLAWFNEAHYLAEVLATRSSESFLNLSQNNEGKLLEADEDSESCIYSNESTSNSSKENLKNKSPVKMRPPAMPVKRTKQRAASEKSPSEIPIAIQHLDKIAQNASEEKPYDQFGKFVAAELRQLPQRHAILLQQEIQNSIIHAKLSSLEQVVYSNPQVIDDVFSLSSSNSIASDSVSSNDGDGV